MTALSKRIFIFPFVLALVSPLSSAEIQGKVAGIKGDILYISVSGDQLPQPGDLVTVVWQLEGEKLEAGTAIVIDTREKQVSARITSGNPSIGMVARIESSSTQTTSGPHSEQRSGDPSLYRTPEDVARLIVSRGERFFQKGDYATAQELEKQEEYERAVNLYLKIADNDPDRGTRAIAQYRLAKIDLWAKNDTDGVKWLKRSAENGHPYAQTSLALMYKAGQGVERDYAEHLKWLRRAVAYYPRAKNYLGVAYEEGIGVPKDIEEAIRLYRAAAAAGSRRAKENLKRLGVE